MSDEHVAVAVSSRTECRSWLCVTDLASCAVVFSAEIAGHVTAGRMTSQGDRVYVAAGSALHVYALKPDIRFVDKTQLGADARAIVFTKVYHCDFFHIHRCIQGLGLHGGGSLC